MFTHAMMSDEEREVMQGRGRFIIVPDRRYTRGVRGGIILAIPTEETQVLQAFDNSSEDEYEVLRHEVVAVTRPAAAPDEVIENTLPAILVARKKIYGRNYGQWRDPQNYDPYEPFGVGSARLRALETAEMVRDAF